MRKKNRTIIRRAKRVVVLNPRGKHLPGATAKQQRQYEHILKSQLERGTPIKDAKRIAAATVRARHNPARLSQADIARLPAHVQAQIQRQIGAIEKKEEKASAAPTDTPAQRKRVIKQYRSIEKQKKTLLQKIVAKMKHLAGPSSQKITAKEARRGKRFQNAGRRRRNESVEMGFWRGGKFHPIRASDDYDPEAVGEERQYAPAKKKRKSAKKKTTRRRNPSYTVEAIPKYTGTVKETISALTRGSAIRKVRSKVPGPKNIYRYRVEKNPSRRKGLHGQYAQARRSGKGSKQEKRERYVARQWARVTRGRNPSPAEIRREFAGSVSGHRDLYFPEGTPQGLAKLGKLISITTEEGTIKPVAGSAWLCADTHGHLHLGSTSGAPLYDGPKRDFGEVSKVEYEDVKKHLGYTKPTIFFHHVGERTGERPTLHADGRGGLVFRGGAYWIGPRGLEN